MAASFKLVTAGKALVEIHVGTRAAQPVQFAAGELQRYVAQISGASLPIVCGKGSSNQVIISKAGTSPNLTRPARSRRGDNPDSYRMAVTDDELIISGASTAAVLYGAYDVLEQLGCGFCVPGDDTVPQRKSLSLEHCDITVSPAYAYRAQVEFPLQSLHQSATLIDWLAKNRLNWYHACPNSHGLPVRANASPPGEYPPSSARGRPNLWLQRSEMVRSELKKRGLHLQFGGHTMHTWLSREHYFEKHPDWFALVNGERGGEQNSQKGALCVSNPAMRKEMVRNIRLFLNENPEVEVIDFWHPDADDFCHCPECLGGMPADQGDEFIGMAYLKSYIDCCNYMAAELQKTHPGVMVSPLVNYSLSTNWPLPHGCVVDDHLLVGLAHFPPLRDSYRPLAGEPKSTGNERLLGIDMSWNGGSKHTYLYEYYNSWYTPFIHPQVRMAAGDMKLLNKLGFDGISSDMWGWTPLNVYVTARLMWDPHQNVDEVARDFCRRYYGEVADAMFDYWMALEDLVHGLPGYLSSPHINELVKKHSKKQLSLLKKIRDRVKDEQVRVRVERTMLPWHHAGDKEAARWWAVPSFKEPAPDVVA